MNRTVAKRSPNFSFSGIVNAGIGGLGIAWCLWCALFFFAFAGRTSATADVRGAVPSQTQVNLPFAIDDFDGDMRPDLAVVQIGQSNSSQTSYLIQLQLSTTGRQTIVLVAPAGGLQVAARDVNGDHAPDLVLTTAWSQAPVAIYLNDGHGSFTRVDPNTFPGAFAQSKTGLSSASLGIVESVGIPQQSRLGVYREAKRCPYSPEQMGNVRSLNSEFVSSRLLISIQGRAPPSTISHS